MLGNDVTEVNECCIKFLSFLYLSSNGYILNSPYVVKVIVIFIPLRYPDRVDLPILEFPIKTIPFLYFIWLFSCPSKNLSYNNSTPFFTDWSYLDRELITT